MIPALCPTYLTFLTFIRKSVGKERVQGWGNNSSKRFNRLVTLDTRPDSLDESVPNLTWKVDLTCYGG